MDRLPALILLALGGCADGSAPAKPGSSRVASVQAAPAADPKEVASQWCDVFTEPAQSSAFSYPDLVRGSPKPLASPRWVNVWATWCKPCVEELPRVAQFHRRLSDGGVRVELELLAADELELVERFASEHPSASQSNVVADPSSVEGWLKGLGMPSSALPVHVFVDSQQRLRCARLGGVSDQDFESVQAVLRSL